MTSARLAILGLAAAVVGAVPATMAAAKTVDLRMRIFDADGKTLAAPMVHVAVDHEAKLELLVSGWQTNIAVAVGRSNRADCYQVKVSFDERRADQQGSTGQRRATGAAEICDAASMSVGDEKTRMLHVAVHAAGAQAP